MAAERKRGIRMNEEPVDFPPAERVFLCGTLGVWSGTAFQGAIGCNRPFVKANFDFHAQVCFSCTKAACAEYDVPRESGGPLEAALRAHHRFIGYLDGFGSIGKREAVRMLVLASRAIVNNPTERENLGAGKIVSRFPSMTGIWNEEDRGALNREISKIGELR